MDDVLARQQLNVVGANAVHAVVIHHPGFVLYPVDAADAADAAAEQMTWDHPAGQHQHECASNRKLQALAVFVAQQMLGSDNEEEEDGPNDKEQQQ